MKAVATHTLLPVRQGDGVRRSLGRHGVVKDGVEAGVVPGARKALHHLADEGNGRRIMKRGKADCLLQIFQHFFGDELMPVKQGAGVNYAITDRIDRRHAGAADGAL